MPIRDENNDIVGTIVNIHDISEMKHAENQLERKIAALTETNRKLETYAYTNRELTQFSYITSHQLQTPARTISNYVNIIKEDFGDELKHDCLKYLNIILDSSKKMSVYIDALLDYSNIGRKKELIVTDINNLVNQVISDISCIHHYSEARILTGKLPEMPVYQIEFRQLVQNLLINAIKFQIKGNIPVVEINSERSDHHWTFSVKDNGIGIDHRHKEKIFEMFQRLHLDEHEYEGIGIGLAYCRKIVELHKGRIWVESSEGKGATFFFTIPDPRS